jgi:hypothetical protein
MKTAKKGTTAKYTFAEWEKKYFPETAKFERESRDDAETVSERLITNAADVLRKRLKRVSAPAARERTSLKSAKPT